MSEPKPPANLGNTKTLQQHLQVWVYNSAEFIFQPGAFTDSSPHSYEAWDELVHVLFMGFDAKFTLVK